MGIRAVYEQGMLRLLDPVNLDEGQEIRIKIEEDITQDSLREALGDLAMSWPDPDAEEAILRLVLGDLIEWPSQDDDSDAWVEAMADEIDRAFQGTPPLSELIIEDRGEL